MRQQVREAAAIKNVAKGGMQHIKRLIRLLMYSGAPLVIVQLVLLVGTANLDHKPIVDQAEYFAGMKAAQT